MRRHWIKKEGNGGLLVIVLGWASDYRVAGHIRPDGFDVLCLYDYRDIPPDGRIGDMPFAAGLADEISDESYSVRCLMAWSFGVWAAGRIFGGGRAVFDHSVALNGTPLPVHDLYGIEPRRLAVTIRGLRSGGMDAFNRRAYGEYYEKLGPFLAPRPLEDNITELEVLRKASSERYELTLRWGTAVVGSGDEIFPPENMLRYWGGRAKVLPLPHYPFADADLIAGFLPEV